MAVLLALVAAVGYGIADFVAASATRRSNPWRIALVVQLAGAGLAIAIALVRPDAPRAADFGWAVIAGLGNGVGTALLYRGLGSGRMGVVAPVSGVGAAVLPVVVGLVSGERPGLLSVLGVVVALPAIWLIASQAPGPSPQRAWPLSTAPASTAVPPGPGASGAGGSSALLDGVLGGVGFGILFSALSRLSSHAGLLPFGLDQLVGAAVVLATAAILHQSLRGPRQGPFTGRGPGATTSGLGVVAGVLGTSSTVVFAVSTRHGLLSVTSVITSLYPAVTIVLAATVLTERIHRRQGLGLALCATAVALIAG